jgi:pimeloyl-ACP methyl ester carboxylesterase
MPIRQRGSITFTENRHPGKEAVLFLHGFPADSGKNEDVAEALSVRKKITTFVPHFRGLGLSKGRFLFSSTFSDSLDFVEYLTKKRHLEKITVVAHSWGALPALNLVTKECKHLERIILLAPLCFLPDPSEGRAVLEEFRSSEVAKGKRPHSTDKLLADFELIRAKGAFSVVERLQNPKLHITIIQGKNDTVTPPEGAKRLSRMLVGRSTLIEIEDDHWFKSREQLIELVSAEI